MVDLLVWLKDLIHQFFISRIYIYISVILFRFTTIDFGDSVVFGPIY